MRANELSTVRMQALCLSDPVGRHTAGVALCCLNLWSAERMACKALVLDCNNNGSTVHVLLVQRQIINGHSRSVLGLASPTLHSRL